MTFHVNLKVYQMLPFSGMFMMWSSGSLLDVCGEQDWKAKGFVVILIKCFSSAFSLFRMQSGEPGLVPVKPQTLIFHHCSQNKNYIPIEIIGNKITSACIIQYNREDNSSKNWTARTSF